MLLFFLQAEDGIGGLVRSRGLGDVYKRQVPVRRDVLADPLAVFSEKYREWMRPGLSAHEQIAGEGGARRLVPYSRKSLYKPETAVLSVGYQAEGSLGRRLVDGNKLVSIFGEKVAVKASIHTLKRRKMICAQG